LKFKNCPFFRKQNAENFFMFLINKEFLPKSSQLEELMITEDLIFKINK